MNVPQTIGIIGGGGFLGTAVVQKLSKSQNLLKIGSRHPSDHVHLKVAATIGKIQVIQCDVRSKESIQEFIKGCDIVINLVGIIYERRKNTFQRTHVDAATTIAQSCSKSGVKQLIHLSALGCDQQKSRYARSKLAGEVALKQHFPQAVILRPSVIFGEGDHFFSKFAAMVSISPFLPVFKGGNTRFQPVFVEDVARAVEHIIQQKVHGKTYDLGGPDIYTFRELLEITNDVLQKNRSIISLPTLFGHGIAFFSRFLQEPLLTADQLKSLEGDSVIGEKNPTLADLGIIPQRLKDILPSCLARFQ